MKTKQGCIQDDGWEDPHVPLQEVRQAPPARPVRSRPPPLMRVISCGMCGEKHPASAKCSIGAWLRHRARQLTKADDRLAPGPWTETGSMGRLLRSAVGKRPQAL